MRSPAKPQKLGQICRGWNLHLAPVSKAARYNSQDVDPLTCHWYWAATALHHFLLRFSPGSCSLVIFAASWWNTLTVIHDYSSPSAFFLHLSLVRLPPLLAAFLRSCLCSRKPLLLLDCLATREMSLHMRPSRLTWLQTAFSKSLKDLGLAVVSARGSFEGKSGSLSRGSSINNFI